MKSTLLYFVLHIFLFASGYAQGIHLKRIDSLLQSATSRGIFNGNLLLARGGQIIYEKAWGFADATRTRPLTKEMLFDIGSISKEFNGVGIMLLKEQGKLQLEDLVSKYIHGLPSWAAKVQLKHLLNYTSGLPNFTPQSSETDAALLDSLQALKQLKFESGSAYNYAHANVYLQRKIIEKVSGLSYAQFINRQIFKPIGMKHSFIDADLKRNDVAKAFDNDYQPTPYLQLGSGFVRLTARDLYAFITYLEAYKLISRESFEQLAINFPGGESSLGTTSFKDGKLIWHRHQGSNSNYEALVYTDHVNDFSLVLQTNNQNFKLDAIKTAVLHILKNEPFEVPKKSIYLDIRDKALNSLEKGLAFYQEIKANHQDKYDFTAEAPDLISTGKYLQRRNRLDDAIKLYALALPLCLRSSDTSYASELTAECYLSKGDTIQAKAWYEKALAANPANKNAKSMLSTLK